MSNHKEIFTEIYDRNVWGGSGGGSTKEVTEQYRELIQRLLLDLKIKSVVDFGCGDWAFSQYIDWSDVDYLGVDVVESVIERNSIKYGNNNIKFSLADALLKGGDLLIIKDVFQHWSNKEIHYFMIFEARYFKYILITNTSNQTKDDQDNIDPHINTRPLSAKFLPLSRYSPIILLETNIYEPKETSLITTGI